MAFEARILELPKILHDRRALIFIDVLTVLLTEKD